MITDFTRVGLIDDRRFARAFVHSRMARKPVSRRLLLHQLKAAGIEGHKADEAVEDVYHNKSESMVAADLVRKRLGRLRGDAPMAVRKKLSDFLARRGFSWETISEALKAMNEE